MEDFLSSEEKSEEDLTNDLTEAADKAIKAQLLLDSFADAEELEVSDDEFTREVIHQAGHAGMPPQQYYDQLSRAGLVPSLALEVRRTKILSALIERVTVKEPDGSVVSAEELREAGDGHDHG